MSHQDGGDPAVEASPRDIMYTLDAAHAEAKPEKLAETDLRCTSAPQLDQPGKEVAGMLSGCC